jgi:hypothetical protein
MTRNWNNLQQVRSILKYTVISIENLLFGSDSLTDANNNISLEIKEFM